VLEESRLRGSANSKIDVQDVVPLRRENFNNIDTHLNSVLSACEVKALDREALQTHFSLDYVQESLVSVTAPNTLTFRQFNAFYLKFTSLIEKFRYKKLPLKKQEYFLSEDGS